MRQRSSAGRVIAVPRHTSGEEVDLIADQEAKTVTVRLRPLANASTDEALKYLCAEINAS
jgi:hypothetical protein